MAVWSGQQVSADTMEVSGDTREVPADTREVFADTIQEGVLLACPHLH